MSTPVLHLVVGPNGAGKTTFYEEILRPATRLPFINADIADRRSFVTETVFSHPSKLELLRMAAAAGYRRYLHVILIPEELAVQRVAVRVETGGHEVPEEKIRSRFRRLWPLVRQAIALADEAEVRDNSRAKTAFRLVARYHRGEMVGSADWPPWTPPELRQREL